MTILIAVQYEQPGIFSLGISILTWLQYLLEIHVFKVFSVIKLKVSRLQGQPRFFF